MEAIQPKATDELKDQHITVSRQDLNEPTL
jgi:hypothetical protein